MRIIVACLVHVIFTGLITLLLKYLSHYSKFLIRTFCYTHNHTQMHTCLQVHACMYVYVSAHERICMEWLPGVVFIMWEAIIIALKNR